MSHTLWSSIGALHRATSAPPVVPPRRRGGRGGRAHEPPSLRGRTRPRRPRDRRPWRGRRDQREARAPLQQVRDIQRPLRLDAEGEARRPGPGPPRRSVRATTAGIRPTTTRHRPRCRSGAPAGRGPAGPPPPGHRPARPPRGDPRGPARRVGDEVDDVLGDAPVGRELAARDGDPAVAMVVHDVPAGEIRAGGRGRLMLRGRHGRMPANAPITLRASGRPRARAR